MSDKLYDLLTEKRASEIPWAKAAEFFVNIKLASGGLLPREIDALKTAAMFAPAEPVEKTAETTHPDFQRDLARQQLHDAIMSEKVKGVLSGIRGSAAQDITHASRIRRQRGERVGKTVGSLAGAAAGMLAGKKLGVDPLRAGALAAALGYGGGKAVGSEVDRRRIKSRYSPKHAAIEKTSAKAEGEATEIPIQDGLPLPAGDLDPLEAFLQAQQEANELEFFRQQAEEAQAAASDAEERAQSAEDQLQVTEQQRQMEQQQLSMQQQTQAQQQMAAQQHAQMAQQDAVQARDESLAAQQANIALRQSITAYRQALMNLLAQDPTQIVPPAPVPQGPMPGMEQGQPPPEQGQEAGPPPEMAGPQGPPAPQGGPEMAGPPPGGPPMMQPPPGQMGPPPMQPPPGPAGPPAEMPQMQAAPKPPALKAGPQAA